MSKEGRNMFATAGRRVLLVISTVLLASTIAVPARAADSPPMARAAQRAGFFAIMARTSILVPDGGSASVASYGSLDEGRTEAGVPVLGKTPYLRRGFGNVSNGRRTRYRSIRVKVRVISLREEEERQTGVRR
jgi:hypothetical protein